LQVRRPTTLWLLSLLMLAGCGHGPATAPLQARETSVHAPTAMVAGVERTFGFDMARYQHLMKTGHSALAFIGPADMPAKMDNRHYCSAVANQGKLGSCTAFALGKGLREYNQIRNGEHQTPLSPLWLYYNERAHMGPDFINRDSGATLTDGTYVLRNLGCATESSWPYAIPMFAVTPTGAADASAANWKLRRPQWLSGLADTKAALASGQAVAFGFKAFESIRSIGPDGLMPMPQSGERVLGGHAVLAVGYDDVSQRLIVRNSWGESFGDHGYFYMPYAFVLDSTNTMDFWTAPA
jgi:C1A family cysteine protease